MGSPDFFLSRLDAMIGLRHLLAVLANWMPWSSIEATLAQMSCRMLARAMVSREVDLFGVAADSGHRPVGNDAGSSDRRRSKGR
jgi:transposase, IS5 family